MRPNLIEAVKRKDANAAAVTTSDRRGTTCAVESN
jgi:hypothetical protein